MARPEGYRKAVRLMEMADRFGIPVISLVDTAGAYPGIGAEERGQAEAIARSTDACLSLGVPNVAVDHRRRRLGRRDRDRHRQPRADARTRDLQRDLAGGAASILWRERRKAQEAATNMKITAQDMLRFGVIDTSSSSRPAAPIAIRMRRRSAAGEAIAEALKDFEHMSADELRTARADKFLNIGRKA